MPAARLPETEPLRLVALASYEVLDTACEQSFDNIARLACRLTQCPVALVSLVDGERQWFKARIGFEPQETHRDLAFCAHAVLAPAETLVVADATLDARFADNALVTAEAGIRFYAGVPLVNPDGHALGTLCIIDQRPRTLSAEAQETLEGLAQTVMTTLELRRAMLRARDLALTDALTGLSNRPAFLQALRQAVARQQRDGSPFSLLYMDLDGLKRVNDVRGHATGDDVLRGTASVMRENARAQDTAARLGGDEFAIVLIGGDSDETAAVAERLRLALKRHMDDAGWPVTVSIGAVNFKHAPTDDAEALEVADLLMYGAKRGGGNRVIFRESSLKNARPAQLLA